MREAKRVKFAYKETDNNAALGPLVFCSGSTLISQHTRPTAHRSELFTSRCTALTKKKRVLSVQKNWNKSKENATTKNVPVSNHYDSNIFSGSTGRAQPRAQRHGTYLSTHTHYIFIAPSKAKQDGKTHAFNVDLFESGLCMSTYRPARDEIKNRKKRKVCARDARNVFC